MDGYDRVNFSLPDEQQRFYAALFEQDPFELEGDSFSNKGRMLIVALLLSLGLWTVIGVAVAALLGNRPI